MRHELGGAMAAVSNGRPRAIPFNPLKPFNGYGLLIS